MNNTDERIALLRKAMKEQNIDAFIIPSSDPHQSEYTADRFKAREWISGFDGSAGTVVITANHAGLWTDSRYFIQAEEQLANCEMVLHKIITQGQPEFILWINENMEEKSSIACDGLLLSKGQFDQYERLLKSSSSKLISQDLIEDIWRGRPELLKHEVFHLPIEYTGQSAAHKIEALRQEFWAKADNYLLTALDDIAWLFNLRCNDVTYNPVFYAYALVGKENVILFADPEKFSSELIQELASLSIELKSYDSIISYLNEMDTSESVYVATSDISYGLYRAINASVYKGDNIVRILKGIKNDVEVSNIRNAMEKDGVALARMYMWLEETLESRTVKETEVAEKIAFYRSQQKDYVGESFGAIVGYRGNGAIVHYSAREESCADISKNGMLLIDSGGQYKDGTTDITRTTHLGTPSDEEKLANTMVLKGHIGLDLAKYPHGTKGVQLDTLARMHLWEHGLNYGHGTGHGVGFFLNVHEPPQGFAPIWGARSKTILEEGMVTSNEPGFYKIDGFGIRIENLILTVKDESTQYGNFLSHETLTLFPIELKLIDETLVTAREKAWFNRYHQEVYKRLAPRMEEHEQKWLERKCKPLN